MRQVKKKTVSLNTNKLVALSGLNNYILKTEYLVGCSSVWVCVQGLFEFYSVTVIKQSTQKKLREEKVYGVPSFYTSRSQFGFRGNQERTQDRNQEAGTIEEYCLLACSLACTASSLMSPKSPALGWHSPQGVGPSDINQGRHCFRPIWWSQFFLWASLFPADSSLCQIDNKQANK